MVRFDDALGIAIAAIRRQLARRETSITMVRDVGGQITAVLPDDALGADEWAQLGAELDKKLEAYSPGHRRVLLRASDLIDATDVVASPDRVRLAEYEGVWLVDRLLTNQDWLRHPAIVVPRIPLATAFSLKGGVGRSTALAVLAWHLARQGRRVVAVDLDLEAPGLGSVLLNELPDYGLIDWLVDGRVSAPDVGALTDYLAPSPVSDDTSGHVQVMPAFGGKTREYVTKVGRVFLPGLSPEGEEEGLAQRLSTLVRLFSEQLEPPDVVLLDARAGLHDIGAAAVTQLGAEVFLFARDEPQSWESYRLLLEHLARSKGVVYGMPDDDLRWRLKMVAAQLDKTEGALDAYVETSYETWSALYDDESRAASSAAEAQTFVRDDLDAPHYPLTIYFDGGLRSLVLVRRDQRPPWPVIEAAFGAFLTDATARLGLQGAP
ncbi:MAG: hypothetical protein AAB426_06000 [Myxococcota bacterium]